MSNQQPTSHMQPSSGHNVVLTPFCCIIMVEVQGVFCHYIASSRNSLGVRVLIMRNIYFSERRWLSKMLNRLCDLQSAIEPFTGSKGKFVPEHREKCFLDLAFLVDLTTYLNELNMRLQGENHLICAMFQSV